MSLPSAEHCEAATSTFAAFVKQVVHSEHFTQTAQAVLSVATPVVCAAAAVTAVATTAAFRAISNHRKRVLDLKEEEPLVADTVDGLRKRIRMLEEQLEQQQEQPAAVMSTSEVTIVELTSASSLVSTTPPLEESEDDEEEEIREVNEPEQQDEEEQGSIMNEEDEEDASSSSSSNSDSSEDEEEEEEEEEEPQTTPLPFERLVKVAEADLTQNNNNMPVFPRYNAFAQQKSTPAFTSASTPPPPHISPPQHNTTGLNFSFLNALDPPRSSQEFESFKYPDFNFRVGAVSSSSRFPRRALNRSAAAMPTFNDDDDDLPEEEDE